MKMEDVKMTNIMAHYNTAVTRDRLYEMMFQDICVARSFLNADEDTLIQFAKAANEVAEKRGWEKLVSGV